MFTIRKKKQIDVYFLAVQNMTQNTAISSEKYTLGNKTAQRKNGLHTSQCTNIKQCIS